MIAAGIFAYRHHASRRTGGGLPIEVAYVLPAALEVVDTPAEIRLPVESLKAGDQVEILLHTRNWAKVRLADGRTGWIQSKDLLDSQAFETGQKLLKDMESLPLQAEGHSPEMVNLRFEPSRESTPLAQLTANQKVDIFSRKVVERPSRLDQPSSPPVKEAWYLVRAGARAGWVLGRSVTLDVPESLSSYAQGTNIVAWQTLNTVADEDRQVPQYLTADRMGNQDVDFTHIRVFTWWVKNHEYVTAYTEGGLQGYFPISVAQRDKVPYFRLRLIDENGKKIQKVYRLSDTITKPLGIVDGWESDEMPVPSASHSVRHRR